MLAASALVLVERGRLELDAPLAGQPYTLRHLLRHQSGLPDYGTLDAYHTAVAAGDAPWPESEMLRRADAGSLLFEPGRGWAYSNIGYLIVRRLVEQASDAPLGAALRTLVLDPLGVEGVILASVPGDLVATAWGNDRAYDPAWVYHGLVVGPASGAALFLYRLMGGSLLSGPILDAMREAWPVCGALPGRPWLSVGYGLGLAECHTAGGRLCGHTGEGPGSVAAVLIREQGGGPGAGNPISTVAVFAAIEDPGVVEREAVALMSSRRVA